MSTTTTSTFSDIKLGLRSGVVAFICAFIAAVLAPVLTLAQTNSGITYHGRILKPDGTPLNGTVVQFKMQIRSPGNENCLLYEEIQTKNLSQANGGFSITINDGSGTRGNDEYSPGLRYALDRVFQNRHAFSQVAACDTGTTYSPNSADGRRFSVYFKDETMGGWEEAPASQINFVPLALDSRTVGGLNPSNFLKVDDSAAGSNTTLLNTTQLTDLIALIAGTSNKYTKQSVTTGAQLPSSSSMPSGATAGSIWYDPSTQELKFNNGTSTPVVLSNSGAATLPDVGTAGTYTKVTTDAKGRVTSGQAQITESDISGSISTAGKVSGTAITSGNISTSGNFTTSGTLTSTGNITTSANITATGALTSSTVRIYDGSGNYITMASPSLAADYSLTWPNALPGSDKVLQVSSTGILSWVDASAGSVTSVSSANNYLTVTSATTTPVLTVNVGTTANTVAAGNDSRIVNAAQTNSPATFTSVTGTSLVLKDGQTTPNTVTLQAPATITTSYAVKMPPAAATVAGQMLTSDLSGNLSWTTPSTTATAYSGVLPIANGGTGAATSAQNSVFAGPATGGTGAPSFRALAAADLPSGVLFGSSITTGYVPYVSASNTLSNSALYYSGSNVGIGITSPARVLHISGPMRMVASSLPASPVTGDMAIDTDDSNKLKWYDGSGWQNAGGTISTAGIASLGGLTGATQTFASGSSGNTPAIASSGTVHTLNVPLASAGSGVTSGTISNADYLKFDAKVGTSTSFSGDVTGTYNATSLDKIKGAALTITTPVAGQYLKYTAGGWVNSAIATGDVSGLTTALGDKVGYSAFPSTCTGGQTIVFTSPANTFTCSNISLPASQITGQVAVANGGTGAATAAQNSVFAGPATGGTGAPSFRAIASTDLPTSGVTPGTYGAANKVSQVVVDSYGRVTSATEVTISGVSPVGTTLTSGNIWVGSASNVAAAVAPAGDVTLSNLGAFKVVALQNKAVSATLPTTAGQLLRYDGTSWTPNFVSMADLRSTITGASALTSCAASQTLTWSAATDNLACSNISGLTGTNFSSQSANQFFASPTGSSGNPVFRSLDITDLPAVANGTLLSNISGSSAKPAANSLSSVIDSATSNARGSILYRGSSGWTHLAPGASGSFLKTQGTSADPVWDTISSGSVTSVGLSLPSIFTVTNSPVTSSGTLTATLASQSANTFLAAPSGSAGAPTFRTLASSDLPTAGTAGTYGSATAVPVITTDAYGRVTSVTNTTITASATSLTGVVAIANGGTGAATTSQNFVFAGPTSGTGAPSYRGLVSGDLPSGTLSGAGTAGYIPYYSTTTGLANSQLFMNGSDVGVGTAFPASRFHVVHPLLKTNTTRQEVFTLSSADTSSYHKFYVSMTGAAALDNRVANLQTADHFVTNGGILSLQGEGGVVGVGTLNPKAQLDVAGTLKISATAETCSVAADGGLIRYSSNSLQYCNGSSWQTVGTGAGGISSLGGQSGATQTFAAGSSGTAPAIASSGNVHTLNVPLASGTGVTSGTITKTQYDTFNAKLGTTTTFGGDVSSTYDAISVNKIKGVALTMTSLTSGQFLKYNGTAWVNSAVAISEVTGLSTQLNNKLDVAAMSGSCTTSQTLTFTSPTGTWTCANISLPATQLTGTIDSARLPASITDGAWSASSGNAYRTSGNVGIGTSSPGSTVDVAGTTATNSSIEGIASYTNSTTAYTIPDATLNIRRITLTGNATITLPAFASPTGKVWTLTVMVKQDGTGNRTLAFSPPATNSILWDSSASLPAPQTTANSVTIYQFTKPSDETVWYASMVWKQN